MEMSGQVVSFTPWPLYHRKGTPGNQREVGWVGPNGAEGKYLYCTCRESNGRSISNSLHRVSYRGSTYRG